ncbi:MAG: hypothetical protein SFY68_07870 [Candidatus Sumerlaeia bacterium]|nr:hypothetical protein [Candidatus Sumerlaeia bacterium]
MPETPIQPHGERVHALDAVRGLAILLALFTHTLDVFRGSVPLLTEVGDLLSPLLRSATGIFILIIGVLLEWVYGADSNRPAGGRLLQRAMICWIYGIGLTFLGEISGVNGAGSTLRSALFLDAGRLADAFPFLALLLGTMALLLPIRRIVGLPVLWCATLGLYTLCSLFAFTSGGGGFSENLSALLFGSPQGASAFSLGHMLFLVSTGMVLGGRLRSEPGSKLGLRLLLLACLLLLCAASWSFAVWEQLWGLRAILLQRTAHSLGYYLLILGMGCGLLGCFLCWSATGRDWKLLEWVGRHSLVCFFGGNALLVGYLGFIRWWGEG